MIMRIYDYRDTYATIVRPRDIEHLYFDTIPTSEGNAFAISMYLSKTAYPYLQAGRKIELFPSNEDRLLRAYAIAKAIEKDRKGSEPPGHVRTSI